MSKWATTKYLEELITSRTILISDYAGAGKTTALKAAAVKLKSKFSHKWIEFIDLKRHFDAYENHKNQEFSSVEQIANFFSSKILNLDQFEGEIFTQLFKTGNVALLFDGVDEISPSFNEFACKLFEKS